MYYAATIIQMSGVYNPQTAVWMASATAVLNFLVNFLGVWLVERIGRRLLTLSSLAGNNYLSTPTYTY
jgi:SP family myo-inositol transporter-like MFS transporter 13